MNRREFLIKSSGCIAIVATLSVMPACSLLNQSPSNKLKFVSAGKLVNPSNSTPQYIVVGLDNQANLLWQTNLPERAHASTISPNGHLIVVTGRRPSTLAWLLDSQTGKILHTITAQKNRHFFGHTIFDATGQYLFSTENNTENFAGKICKRAVKNPNVVINEYNSHGVGCHELHLMADNTTLVVANGGIKTAQNSREKLNLSSMKPNLAYINTVTGACIQKIEPPHHQLSIRHIDVSHNGTVAIGMQYQGKKSDNLPLLFTHKLGQPHLIPINIENNKWHIFNQYIGSVTIKKDGSAFMASSPRGNCAVLVDTASNKITKKLALRDCCGVALNFDETLQDNHPFVVSDGIGQISPITIDKNHTQVDTQQAKNHSQFQFDNHMFGG